MTSQAQNKDDLPLSDTLYASLCQVAETALRGSSGTIILPAELVHECFLKLLRSEIVAPTDPIEFRALAATMIRHALVDRVRHHRAQKRGDSWARVALQEDPIDQSQTLDFDLLVLDEALENLAGLDSRQARIVELRFFGGLSISEVAHSMQIAPRTVNADWALARAWLRRALS